MNFSEQLRIKKSQNLERLNREYFLKKLDGELLQIFQSAEFIYGNEVPEDIIVLIQEVDAGSHLHLISEDEEFDDLDLLCKALPEQQGEFKNRKAYLRLGPEYTIFIVDFSQVYPFFPSLIKLMKEFSGFWLISDEKPTIGVMIDEYVGYLTKVKMTNSNEVVFTLKYWGFDK